jgi:F420H(2)-dependent quinone reductase
MKTYNPEFLYLTTTGWKSGQQHEIEIWFLAYEGCYYLCAEHREKTHWVQNVQRHPAVTFWVNGQTYVGQGHAVDPAAEPEKMKALIALFDQKYNWSDGLFVELCPNNP